MNPRRRIHRTLVWSPYTGWRPVARGITHDAGTARARARETVKRGRLATVQPGWVTWQPWLGAGLFLGESPDWTGATWPNDSYDGRPPVDMRPCQVCRRLTRELPEMPGPPLCPRCRILGHHP